MSTTVKRVLAIGAVLLVALGAFAGGLVVGGGAKIVPELETPTSLDGAVNEVRGIIERDALKPSSEESMTAGAIRGMLESLEDSHAMYFDAAHYAYFNEQTNGSFYGIGVTISNEGNDLVVNSVLEGTPAEAAGLKAKDIIVTIDGEAREKWDVDEAVLRIRGEEGTTVTLGIKRGDAPVRDFKVTRAKIDVPNIESELLESGIGYIRLYSFAQPSASDITKAVDKLAAEGAKGYILDLRDNPGGLLDSAVEVGSLFIKEGVLVKVQDRSGTVEEHRATGETITDAPIVLLINGNSASASEIVGGALQDYGRATLVGEKSYGKGSVQQLEPLSFGGAIKLTIAHYVTPKNRVIDKIGLTPDVVVTMEPELQLDKATDTQLQKAIEVLKGKL